MSHPTKVTIAIPTFRRPEMLRRALESVTRQNYAPLEVIVADNATEGDAVASVIASFQGRIEDLRYVRHEQNIGALGNFMFCLTHASGDYFMWLADDDELSPESVAPLARRLDADHSVVSVVPYWRRMHSRDVGSVMEQRMYESQSALSRVLRYVWRSNDAFFYGLHRRQELLKCRFHRVAWPNATTVVNATFPFLMTLVLAGRIVSVDDPRVEWINHSYTEKSYANPQHFFVKATKLVLLRINVHAIQLAQVFRALGLWAFLVTVPVSIFSLLTEFTSDAVRRLRRSIRSKVDALHSAGQR